MLKGPPPKPTAIKILTGNPGCRPLPKHEPKGEIGEPAKPEGLSKAASQRWDELVPMLIAMGVLAVSDGDALAAYCTCAADVAALTSAITLEGGAAAVQPVKMRVLIDARRQLMQLGAHFGLSPAERARLVAQTPETNPRLELMQYVTRVQ